MVSDRFGTRIAALLGSVLLGVGLVAASRATMLLGQLAFGVLIGAGRQLLRTDDVVRRLPGSSIGAILLPRWSRPGSGSDH